MKRAISLGNRLSERSERSVVLTAAAALILLGLLDHASGPDVAFSAVYLLPLIAVGWRLQENRNLVVSICALASAVWLAAEVTNQALHPIIAIWNAASRFAIFFLIVSLLQALRASLATQQGLAERDPLTGVANQRAFEEAMRDALAESQEEQHPISLVYLDLDDFKSINDTLGHSGGNAVLCSFASALNDTTRSSDTVGRLGGDEFAVILPSAGSAAAQGIMNDLVQRLQGSLREINVDRSITFSAGVVTFLSSPKDLDEMINASDALMYEAKRDGKAGYKHKTFGGTEDGAVPDVHIPRPAALAPKQTTFHF